MNHVRQRLASQTYATKSCFPVAMRLHDPIDRSVHGIMAIAILINKLVIDLIARRRVRIQRLTFVLVNEAM